MNQEHVEHVATVAANHAQWTGAGTGLVGWLMDSQFLGLIGLCIALGGFLVNWYYKHKHYKLALREQEARLGKSAT